MPDSDHRGPRTVRVPPGRIDRWLAGFLERHGESATSPEPDGILVTGADGSTARARAPFAGWVPDPDQPWLGLVAHVETVAREARYGLVLVRRGGYAVGIARGGELINSKVGTRYVQGRTAAGGQSQQRFARRRSNQADALVGSAAAEAIRILAPQVGTLRALVPGGDRALVTAVLEHPRLSRLADLPREPLLTVADPRLAVLRTAAVDALAVRIRVEDQ